MKDKLHLLNEYEKHLDEIDLKPLLKLSSASSLPLSQKRKRTKVKLDVTIKEDEFLPKPYTEDASTPIDKKKDPTEVSRQINELLAKLEAKQPSTSSTPLQDKYQNASPNPVKIYFASRTHSQLNQFASQLRLPSFPSSFSKENDINEKIKYIPLGSKKILCINPNVKKWKTTEAINDACYEVRHSKEGCPYYQNTPEWHTANDTLAFRDNTFAQIHDIEDTVTAGETLGVCPFYACLLYTSRCV